MNALLISAGGGIGDALLATPVVRALRTRFERIAVLSTPGQREVFTHDPAVDEVWTDEARFDELAARVAAARFDAAIVTWATLRTAALPFVARVPVRVGQARRLYSRLFTQRVVVRSERGDHHSHWTQVLLDYARALGCDTADATPAFNVTADELAFADGLLGEHGVAGDFLIFHPTRGLSSERPNWPAAHLGAVARELGERFALRVVVSGGARDRHICDEVARTGGGVSVAGETTLGEFGALALRAQAVVAMDSGPMHVAAAAGAATVGIFALQSDEPQRWAPLGPRTAVVRPVYPCPPAHRKETCPDFACVAAVSADAVALELNGLLRTTRECARGGTSL